MSIIHLHSCLTLSNISYLRQFCGLVSCWVSDNLFLRIAWGEVVEFEQWQIFDIVTAITSNKQKSS